MLPTVFSRKYFPMYSNNLFNTDFMSEFMKEDHKKSSPMVNVIENEKEYTLEVAAPGMNKKDFKIELNNNILNISSEKKEEKESKKENFMRREFSYSTFCRSFELPEEVDAENIKAKYEDGILTIGIPKQEVMVKKAREINIA